MKQFHIRHESGADMQKKTKKRIMAGAVILLAAGILSLSVFYICTSSWVICNHWLPLISRMTGTHISARRVEISFLSAKKNVLVKNLIIVRKNGLTSVIQKAELSVSIPGMIFGNYTIDDVDISGMQITLLKKAEKSGKNEVIHPVKTVEKPPEAHLVPVQENKPSVQPPPEPLKKKSLLSRLVIKRLHIADAVIHYSHESVGRSMSMRIEELELSEFGADRNIKFSMKSVLSADCGTGLNLKSLPLTLAADCVTDEKMIPHEMALDVCVKDVRGTSMGVDLSPLGVTMKIRAMRNGDELIKIKGFELIETFGEGRLSRLSVTGEFEPETKRADISLNAHFKSSQLLQIIGSAFADIRFDGFEAGYLSKLECRNGVGTHSGTLSASAENIRRGDKSTDGTGAVSMLLEHVTGFDLAHHTMTLEKGKVSVSHDGKQVVHAQNASAIQMRGPGGKWFPDIKSISLDIAVSSFPLRLLNVASGNRFEAGNMDANIVFRPVAGKPECRASASLKIENMKLVNMEKTLPAHMNVNGKIETVFQQGRPIRLEESSLYLTSGTTAAASLRVSGAVDTANHSLKLSGRAAINSAALTDTPALKDSGAFKTVLGMLENQPSGIDLSWSIEYWIRTGKISVNSAEASMSTINNGLIMAKLSPWTYSPTESQAKQSLRFSLECTGLALQLLDWIDKKSGNKFRMRLGTSSAITYDFNGKKLSAAGKLSADKAGFIAETLKEKTLSAEYELTLSNGNDLNVKKLILRTDDIFQGSGTFMMDIGNLAFKASAEITKSDKHIAAGIVRLATAPDCVPDFFLSAPENSVVKARSLLSCSIAGKELKIFPGEVNISAPDGGHISASLQSGIEFTWKGGFRQKSSYKVILDSEKYPLTTFNSYFPPSTGFKFRSGRITTKSDVTMTNIYENIMVSGTVSMQDMAYSANDFESMPLNYNISTNSFRIDEYASYLKTDRFMLEAVNGRSSANISANGTFALNRKRPEDFNLIINHLDERAVNSIPADLVKNMQLRKLMLSGFIHSARKPDSKTSETKLSLEIHDFQSEKLTGADSKIIPFSGKVDIDLKKSPETLLVKKFTIDLGANETPLANLIVEGNIIKSAGDRKTQTFRITSSGIDAHALASILRKNGNGNGAVNAKQHAQAAHKEKRSARTSEVPTATPPATTAAKGQGDASARPEMVHDESMTAVIDLDLKNITYTKNLQAECTGTIDFKNNRFSTDNLTFNVNRTPIVIIGFVDVSDPSGYVYEASTNFRRFQMPPAVRAFNPEMEKDFRGEITTAELYVRGKGLSSKDIDKNLVGSAKVKMRDLSIPFQLKNSMLMAKILFIPLQYTPTLLELSSKKTFTKNGISAFMDKTKNIIEGRDNIDFRDARFSVRARNGIIIIDEFVFNGDMIKAENITGTIKMDDGALNLKTETEMGPVIMPVTFTGTLEEPSPDIRAFLIDFLKRNTFNLLKTPLSLLTE